VKKPRLDRLCLELGLVSSRQRARALILAGQVLVDGEVVTKAGAPVKEGAEVTLRQPEHPYVSRGGLKLAAALDAFSLIVTGRSCLDVGASTGGFTDCLLQRGARHVLAVDVGYGQLAWKLRQDDRVTCVERTNARKMDPQLLRDALKDPNAWRPDLAVGDLSFISLTLVLPAVARVVQPGARVLALIKPQFEAGRQDVGKGGVVRDPEARQRAIQKVLDWAAANQWQLGQGMDCPVPGPKGNVEWLQLMRTPAAPANARVPECQNAKMPE